MTSGPSDELLHEVQAAIEPLPTVEGGSMLVLATAGVPPAVALLSTGDVAVVDGEVRVAVHGGSSVATRLGAAFTLVVPDRDEAYRVEVEPAASRPAGDLTVISGPIVSIRPTAEPPWVMRASFQPARDASADRAGAYVSFWSSVRTWLTDGAEGDGPRVPA